MRSVLYLVSFWISSWSTQAQDLMSPTVDILTELGKLRTMEEKLKAMEKEIKELRRENAELQALKVRVSTMEKAAGFPIFKTVGQKYYVSNGMKAKFDHALKFCTDTGGSLALPRSEAENVALSVMHATLDSTYILLGTTDRETEGQFVDLNKKPLTFTSWMPNEPNNHHGNEDCVGIHTNAKWNDLPCDLDYHFVCELTI
ncbi:mannose-binding protein C-like [Pygocentrus nattereri]|uniref:mannose-binding protein C-like n=1 Tax=Pygocentrus nattereri TaxID=42514 RepID=UPI0008142328|nr:mannose-binding protein C-like [Pygocentrus nattereri]